MRIIAGKHKGRALSAPEGHEVRPTSSRAREALFDILAHAKFAERELIEGARVLDAFAGTGALGLEALSRGAAHAIFMERDRHTRGLLAANVKTLGEEARANVMAADAVHPSRAATACDLIFMDPPYGENVAAAALTALAGQGWFADGAVIALELPAKGDFVAPGGFALLDDRRYGKARILFLVTPT
jgi:16S rRNA (guanine966-N2)-methyltransferase